MGLDTMENKCPAEGATSTGLTNNLCERRFAVGERICSVSDCDARVLARGMCQLHYARQRRGVEVAAPVTYIRGATLAERLRAYSEPVSSGCVEWRGQVSQFGYGRLYVNGKKRPAHRLSWEDAYGPVPDGMDIDHCCRNRACVNPEHLQAVTPAENTKRQFLTPEEHMVLRRFGPIYREGL